MPRPSSGASGAAPDRLQSVERGFAVIKSFSEESPAQTLSDVARRTGLSRATARRVLLTLEGLGYVRSHGRLFELTPRVLELGYAYLSARPVPRMAQPYIEQLSRTIHESVVVAVLDDTDIVFAARAQPVRVVTVGLPVGRRVPALHSASGRAMLADRDDDELRELWGRTDHSTVTSRTAADADALIRRIAEVRRRGYAIVDQEAEIGVRSIAVALRNGSNTPIAALGVPTAVGMTPRRDLEHRILPELLRTAEELNAVLATR